VAINPGLVLGPLLHAERPTSLEVIRLLMAGALPAVPRTSFAVADVRDIVRAHRLAMESPHAAGKRYIVAGEHLWMGDIAASWMHTSQREGIGYLRALCRTGCCGQRRDLTARSGSRWISSAFM
jgi:nucleoside-diphosphate-sugar epimerase